MTKARASDAGPQRSVPMSERQEVQKCCEGKEYESCGMKESTYENVCGAAGRGADECKTCGLLISYCLNHQTDAKDAMFAHELRAHPETMPHAIDRIARDETAYALLREQAVNDPEGWRNFFRYIGERRAEISREK